MKTILIAMLLSFSTIAFAGNTCSDSTHKPALSVLYTAYNVLAMNGYQQQAHAFPVQTVKSKTFPGLSVKYYPWSYTHQHSVLAVYHSVSATGKEVARFAVYSNPPVNTIDILDRKLQGLVSASANGKLDFDQKITDQLAYEGLYVLRQCK